MRIWIVALIFYLPTYFTVFGQKTTISLLPRGNDFGEKGYHIKEVIDLRIKKGKIGEMYEIQGNPLPVDFKGRLDAEALHFFNLSTKPTGTNVQNIQARIFELDLKEKISQKSRIYEGDIQLAIGFFKIGEFEPVHLIDFSGSIHYRRSPNRMDMIQEVVNKIFLNALEYFDAWMNMQVMKNPLLATKVKVEIVDRVKPNHQDTVYYDPQRPLIWGDFKDKPSTKSNFNASIFTSFAVQGKTTVESGSIVQMLEIDIYMLPDQSWVKSSSDYALNHEQRHFDLVRIIADRFVETIQKLELDPEMYQATINDAYFDAYRDMNRIQEIYDKETRHGLDVQAQEKWNRLIDEALAGKRREIDQSLIK